MLGMKKNFANPNLEYCFAIFLLKGQSKQNLISNGGEPESSSGLEYSFKLDRFAAQQH
jgi:hypothetical protein